MSEAVPSALPGGIYFITGPEGSGTTAFVRALTNHPAVVKGNAATYGHPSLYGAAGAQLVPAARMCTSRPGVFDLSGVEEMRRRFRDNAAALFAGQAGRRAVFFKYSTPAFRPPLWPVFLPLFDVPEFRVIVIWRRPLDAIYSAFRRFYRDPGRGSRGWLAAAGGYYQAVRHIRWQLARSPRDRWVSVRYETLVTATERTLRDLYAFTDLPYVPADQLLPGRGFSNENGKWKQAVRTALAGDRRAVE